jgi:hypothetical protein
MIFAHIAGLNDSGRDVLYNQAKKYVIVDLDEFTDKIVSDKNMSMLYDKFDYHSDKSKDPNQTKLQQKQEATKAKDIERKMNAYWKNRMDAYLEHAVKLNSKPIILIGYSTYFKNHKITISVNTALKFFQKVDILQHTKTLVEQNLDNYRDEIIEGVFPLEFLNHEALIKKRELLVNQYKKMGYQLDTINNILNSIHIAASTSLPRRLFVASIEDHAKKLPLLDNRLIGYEEDWQAIVSALAKNNPGITKGFSAGKPFIKETISGAFAALNNPVYLYMIDNPKNFAPIATKHKIYKYTTGKPVAYHSKLFIDMAMERLSDLGLHLIPFKEDT